MKEYYYLDIRRKVHGPHSVEAMAAMLKSGALGADTEVAAPGDTAWVRLDSIITPEQVAVAELPPIPTPAVVMSKCPRCEAELKCEAGGIPAKCPACGRVLGAVGFWANMFLPLRLYASFSGRATRAEFWTFSLVSVVLMYGAIFGGALLALVGVAVPGSNTDIMFWSCGITLVGAIIFLFMLVPLCAVQVRRLHDAGFSGWWLGAYLLGSVGYMAVYYFTCWDKWVAMTQSVERSLLNGDTAWVQTMQVAMQSQLSPWLSILNMVCMLLGLMLIVVSFMDSQRGPNKYGPSAKYPLG